METIDMAFEGFYQLCAYVEAVFEEDWRETDESAKAKKLEREKRAIMGHEREVRFYQERIGDIIADRGYEAIEFPPWYSTLEKGVFHEVYGLAGLAPWVYDECEAYKNSSSAKLIGDRLYCLIDGKSKLQPQRIGQKRREQLKRAFLLATPRERLEEGFHEVYLSNGIRITIFSGERTKAGEDIMVFRKYILQELTFDHLAQLGTIPKESIDLFQLMIKIGYNVLFAGQVRSGKTTFLQVWQSYEDTSLEGLAIATDPETPWHRLMPTAPIMQLTADGKDLEKIGKSILRGDCDYILLEEMRDAAAYRLALEITSTGTRRSKATIHDSSAVNIPYKMGSKIKESYGGDLQSIIGQIFKNFQYVFEFYQLPADRSQKRLKGISRFDYDVYGDQVSVHEICRYNQDENCWLWKCDMEDIGSMDWGEGSKQGGSLEYGKEREKMNRLLKSLEKENPLQGRSVIYPRYYNPLRLNYDEEVGIN